VAAPASGAEWQRRAFVYLFFSEESEGRALANCINGLGIGSQRSAAIRMHFEGDPARPQTQLACS